MCVACLCRWVNAASQIDTLSDRGIDGDGDVGASGESCSVEDVEEMTEVDEDGLVVTAALVLAALVVIVP